MNKKILNYLIIPLSVGLISACAANNRKNDIPTGVVTRELAGGGVELVSTAKASPRALKENLFAMKQNTSCDAARLLLKEKIEELGYEKERMQKGKVYLLQGAAYCRILSVYKPAPPR